MRHLSNQRKQSGFTIIEVLIVLAVAGLIMLIVFLAVPALQRNSRNTSRRDDVARILGAAQEAMNNNGGGIAAVTNANITATLGTLAYYTPSGTLPTVAAAPAAVTNGTNIDQVTVYTGGTCAALAGGGMGATSAGATSRQIAVVYTVEPNVHTCTSS